jgi:alginate O-acetyltransferase complex protein AlgJ
MKKRTINKILGAVLLGSAFGMTAVHADGYQPVIGKNNWLFTPYEFAHPEDAADTEATVQLMQKVNKLFERSGIALALLIVPSKIRIYSDQLPDNKKLDAYTADKYENVAKTLLAGGVNVVNLNQPYLTSPQRTGDTPFFLRLDTHWAPSGALLAAETVKAEIDRTPSLKAALAATPEEKYTLVWTKQKVNQRARDLVKLMPAAEAQGYAPEQTLQFKAVRVKESQAGLLAGGDNVGITVIGSSYTNKNTGYPDGLRYTLQRDLLDISIPVDQGPWVGMEAYLKDEAFKTRKPKLIIWEIPERELRSPPNYKFRDARYVSDNNAWLARITDLLK